MNDILAQLTVRDYCCAHCYGHLLMFSEGDGWRVECHRCGPGQGFVTKAYAERRRSESIGEKWEVEDMLNKTGVLPEKPKRKPEDILKEIGFLEKG